MLQYLVVVVVVVAGVTFCSGSFISQDVAQRGINVSISMRFFTLRYANALYTAIFIIVYLPFIIC